MWERFKVQGARVARLPGRLSAADAELTQRFACLPESGLRLAIVSSAGLAVNWQQRLRRLGVVHGRIRFRLMSVQRRLSKW